MKKLVLLGVLAGTFAAATSAQAHGFRVSVAIPPVAVRVGIPAPVYYARPAPVYVAPPPVYVAPAPGLRCSTTGLRGSASGISRPAAGGDRATRSLHSAAPRAPSHWPAIAFAANSAAALLPLIAISLQ